MKDFHDPSLYNQLVDLCKQWNFWNLEHLVECIKKPQYTLYYSSHLNITGKQKAWTSCLFVYKVCNSTDIIYLYAYPEARGHGVALKLLETYWSTLPQGQNETLYLEVRVSNISAIKTYKKFGMSQITIRKNYYKDGEDALIFFKDKT